MPKWLIAMTIVAFVAWIMALSPLAKDIVPADRLGPITAVLSALLGVGPGLSTFNKLKSDRS